MSFIRFFELYPPKGRFICIGLGIMTKIVEKKIEIFQVSRELDHWWDNDSIHDIIKSETCWGQSRKKKHKGKKKTIFYHNFNKKKKKK